jgi:uncharacterized membrane-anchored protein YitT (DUF2179 family)
LEGDMTRRWKTERSERRRFLATFAVLSFASFLMALDYCTFVKWGGLYPAGATGLAMLIQRMLQKVVEMFGWGVTIPFFPINTVLNAIPAWIGFKFIGRRFTLWSVYVIVVTSVLTDILPVKAMTSFIPEADLARLMSDPFVTSLYGGIVFGFAMALCLRWNATTGGTDFIAIYLSEHKGTETWNLILGINAFILLCAGFVFDWSGSLYSIVYQFVSLQVVHLMYRAYQYQTLMIVTTRPKRVCEAIHRLSHHSATVMDAQGGYRGQKTHVVYSVVGADDTAHIYSLCKKIDPDAFINTMNTSHIIGRFYLRPRE